MYKNIKVSVIMPFYNAQNYLHDAIKSWLAQTLSEKELICIDDGSNDDGGKIVSSYSTVNKNIILIQLDKRSGPGVARQKAIDVARGEYIAFLDADDLFSCDWALEKLYKYAVIGAMDICGGLILQQINGKIEKIQRFRELFDSRDLEYLDIKCENAEYDFYFWSFLYKRSFLNANHINFPPLYIYEDPPFLVKAIYYAKWIRIVNVEYYTYRYVPKNKEHSLQYIEDLLDGLTMNLAFAKNKGLCDLFENTIQKVNSLYLDRIVDGVRTLDVNILKKVLRIYNIISENGYHFYPLEYFIYLDSFDDKNILNFRVYIKCKRLFTGYNTIILYGAGNIGKRIYDFLKHKSLGKVLLWIDHYRVGEIESGVMLQDIDVLNKIHVNYDYILIGIDNVQVSTEIRKHINLLGIDCSKIREWVNL